MMHKQAGAIAILSLLAGAAVAAAQDQDQGKKKIETLIFKERQIQGKIRRPQLVLIKAEQRPDFTPMVMQSMDNNLNITEYIKSPSLDASPYSEPFQFNGTVISNYEP